VTLSVRCDAARTSDQVSERGRPRRRRVSRISAPWSISRSPASTPAIWASHTAA